MNGTLATVTIKLSVKNVALLVAAARRAIVFEGRSEDEAAKLVEDDDVRSAIRWVLLPFPDIIPGVEVAEVTGEILTRPLDIADFRTRK